MHPFLAKVTSDELLARAQAARGVRPGRRAVGGRQRDGVPGQRLRVVHDRRGRRREQPAGLSDRQTAEPTHPTRASCSRSRPRLFAEKGFRNTTVRDIADAAGILSGSLYHHFDSKESMVDEILLDVPGGAVRAVRRDPGQRRRPAHQARAGRAGVVRGDRPAPARGRDLPERGGLPAAPSSGSPTSPTATAVPRGLADAAAGGRRRRRAARRPRPRAHLPLHPRHRLGRGLAGTAPAAAARTPRSPTSTSPSSWKGSHACTEAYIVDAVRTPVGKRGGALAGVHSADLAAHTHQRADATAPASTRAPSTT